MKSEGGIRFVAYRIRRPGTESRVTVFIARIFSPALLSVLGQEGILLSSTFQFQIHLGIHRNLWDYRVFFYLCFWFYDLRSYQNILDNLGDHRVLLPGFGTCKCVWETI